MTTFDTSTETEEIPMTPLLPHPLPQAGDEPEQEQDVTAEDLIIGQAEHQLAQIDARREEARKVLADTQADYAKWKRVIDTLRPTPAPPAGTPRPARRTVYTPDTKRTISDAKLDEFLVLLRQKFQPNEQFLTRDASELLQVGSSYAVKVLQEMRVRGDLRLAGRAPGKGIIPLFALLPEQAQVDTEIKREDQS